MENVSLTSFDFKQQRQLCKVTLCFMFQTEMQIYSTVSKALNKFKRPKQELYGSSSYRSEAPHKLVLM